MSSHNTTFNEIYGLKSVAVSDNRDLLSQLVKDPRLEQLKLALKSPNLFSILKIEHWEIRHSNFLVWLLDPSTSHNLHDHFLRWFVLEVFSSDRIEWADEFRVEDYNLHDVKIHREWEHIDLMIEANDFVIGIENKFHSVEHSKQLSRYREVIKSRFPGKECAFVYLTLEGELPAEEEDKAAYATIDYREVRNIIDNILTLYGNSLSDRVRFYLEDYLLLLNRNVMKDDPAVELARKLYKSHQEAFDFIIEHKPDRIYEIGSVIESTIEAMGYRLALCNKGYARFLTAEIEPIVPKTGKGWSSNDAFAFEVAYWENGLTFKTVIAPGDQRNREILIGVMESIPEWVKPSGKKWLVHFRMNKKVKLTSEKYDSVAEIEKVTRTLLDDAKDIIDQVSAGIVKVSDKLVYE